MKNIIQIIVLLVGFFGYSQMTAIYDENFEKTLIDLGIDSDNTVNGQVLTSDIAQVTHLDLSTSNHLPIRDLFAGGGSTEEQLVDFTALKVLNISGIGYEYGYIDGVCILDLSNLQNLEEVYFSSESSHSNSHRNFLQMLFLSNNPNLIKLESLDVSYFYAIDLKDTDLNTPNLIINLEGNSNNTQCCGDLCINVTSPTDAQASQGAYSNWTVTYTNNSNFIINYSNNSNNPNFICNINLNTGISGMSEVNIYPNPVEDQLHIKSELSIEKAYLYDITGKLIKTYHTNQLSQPIDMSSLHSGVYFITLYSDSGKQTIRKLIVE